MKNIRYSSFKTKQQINLPTPAVLPKNKRSSPPTPPNTPHSLPPPPLIKCCLRMADELIGCITIVIVEIISSQKKHYTAHHQCEVYSVLPQTYFHAGKLLVEARRDLKCTHQVHRKRIYESAKICNLPTIPLKYKSKIRPLRID